MIPRPKGLTTIPRDKLELVGSTASVKPLQPRPGGGGPVTHCRWEGHDVFIVTQKPYCTLHHGGLSKN